MRFLVILILLGTIGGGIYYYFLANVKSDVEITGNLQMSQQRSYVVNHSDSSSPSYLAVVKGRLKNNLKNALMNIFIKYVIDGQETSAAIFDLAPGQAVDFNTMGVETSATNPEFYYEGICYDEKSL